MQDDSNLRQPPKRKCLPSKNVFIQALISESECMAVHMVFILCVCPGFIFEPFSCYYPWTRSVLRYTLTHICVVPSDWK